MPTRPRSYFGIVLRNSGFILVLLCGQVQAAKIVLGSASPSGFKACPIGVSIAARWQMGSTPLVPDSVTIRGYDYGDGDDTVAFAIYAANADSSLGAIKCSLTTRIIVTAGTYTYMTQAGFNPVCTLAADTWYWLILKNVGSNGSSTFYSAACDDQPSTTKAYCSHSLNRTWFGGRDSVAGSESWNISSWLTNYIVASQYTCPVKSTLDSIVGWVKDSSTSVKAAVMYAAYLTDSTLIGATVEDSIAANNTYYWKPVAMAAVDTLVRGTNYMLAAWAGDGASLKPVRIKKTGGSVNHWYKVLNYTGSYPTPFTGTLSVDSQMMIYAAITEIFEANIPTAYLTTNLNSYSNAYGPFVRVAGTSVSTQTGQIMILGSSEE